MSFMQIWKIPRGAQLSIQGNIVNLLSVVNSTVHCVLRPRGDSQTIPIRHERQLGYKHHYQAHHLSAFDRFWHEKCAK